MNRLTHQESAFIDWYRSLSEEQQHEVYATVVIRKAELPPTFEQGGCVPNEFNRLTRPYSFDNVLFVRR